MQDGSRKAIIAAFFANLGIAVAKFVGFILTGSAGLLAEAGHSLADTGNQALLLLGAKRAKRAPTPQHQFGFGSERYFWAFVVALVLFSMGGLFALYEGIQKLIHPHEATSIGIAIGILVAAIALESFSLMTAVKEVRHVKPKEMSYWRYTRTAKTPELPVVLMEDVGAEIGLLLALFGVIMTAVTGEPR
ncbi:MAG: cation diffusion facilitator family transporter, partial [Ilumatobacteraceae bacterium]